MRHLHGDRDTEQRKSVFVPFEDEENRQKTPERQKAGIKKDRPCRQEAPRNAGK